jgi:dTDP-glucose 4,6-dehydratase
MILVTGGCGFIGANFILDWLHSHDEALMNLDKLTYAANAANLVEVASDSRYNFRQVDICDRSAIRRALTETRPRAIVHFAAESHVDRSIASPGDFVQTNVVGTFNLLEEARAYWTTLGDAAASEFRFLHVSTDEVYGSLETGDPAFAETTPYAPNSPYAASKAASDHFARAYFHTYGMPVVTTNCSNNYGPLQFPEKLIPLVTLNASEGKPLPVYGTGRNVRDWLFVRDHCAAIRRVLEAGVPGEVYNIGGACEKSNIEVVTEICGILDELRPLPTGNAHSSLIKFVADRPGHDQRYAIDSTKIQRELGWAPAYEFSSAIRSTVDWYLENEAWTAAIRSGEYLTWIDKQYGERLK